MKGENMKVLRNTGWNRNVHSAWVVVDDGGTVVFGSDLASICLAWVESRKPVDSCTCELCE